MDRRSCLEAVAEAIWEGERFLATTHVRPDGDALGGLTALILALETLGKRVDAYTEDAPARMYHFLPAIDRITGGVPSAAVVRGADAGIALDCANIDRAGSVGEHLLRTPRVICIDHHSDGIPFGDIQCVDGTASSTSELLVELLVDILGVGLDDRLATCLLAGHIFDTGRFSQSNATPQAFRNAARLTEAGADPEAIVRYLYDTVPLHCVKLRGIALERAALDAVSGLVWSVLTHDEFAALGARAEDAEGIVADLRGVGEGRAAALVSEVHPGECRVSLRSRDGDVDVACLAMRFGGGGHTRAAGCTIEGRPEDAVRQLIEAAREQLALGQG